MEPPLPNTETFKSCYVCRGFRVVPQHLKHSFYDSYYVCNFHANRKNKPAQKDAAQCQKLTRWVSASNITMY